MRAVFSLHCSMSSSSSVPYSPLCPPALTLPTNQRQHSKKKDPSAPTPAHAARAMQVSPCPLLPFFASLRAPLLVETTPSSSSTSAVAVCSTVLPRTHSSRTGQRERGWLSPLPGALGSGWRWGTPLLFSTGTQFGDVLGWRCFQSRLRGKGEVKDDTWEFTMGLKEDVGNETGRTTSPPILAYLSLPPHPPRQNPPPLPRSLFRSR